MDKELKEKWLKALRGQGDKTYNQGKSFLRYGDCYCCLGVLCDIINPEGWVKEQGGDLFRYYNACAILPVEVRMISKIEIGEAPKLADMNDEGKDFITIAQHIEENINGDEPQAEVGGSAPQQKV
jgi:hypothetical protein